MTERLSRRLGILAVLFVVAALLLIAAYASIGTGPSQGRLHEVVFSQTPTCDSLLYAIPWAVRLGNTTIVLPQNATLPVDGNRALVGLSFSGPSMNQTRISFSVPDGNYRYTLMPSGDWYDPSTNSGSNATGYVHVSGRDVSIVVIPGNPGGGCGY